MTETVRPETEEATAAAVASALADDAPVEIVGHASKRGLGRPVAASRLLDLSRLSGITLYEPEELVLAARAGTPLAEIEAVLSSHRQMLAFEPPDLGPLYGGKAGAATLGGAIACNLSGPRRLTAGAARDHVLGVRGVTGRGELVKAGGRVVKNVTGYDLSKLMAGSFGTLAALTEITVKVLPAPEATRTLLVSGLDAGLALDAMTRALAGPHEVSGAAHLPPGIAARTGIEGAFRTGVSVTALRLEGPAPSVAARSAELRTLLADFGPVEEADGSLSRALWAALGGAAPFAGGDGAVWRLSLPPAAAAHVVAALEALDAECWMDWGGGLVWARLPEGQDARHQRLRATLAVCGGHATLVRAAADIRARVPVFHPQADVVAALAQRVKDAFDPMHILNPGRMYRGV